MSGIIGFLVGCALLAACVVVGFFLLNLLLVIGISLFTGIYVGIVWVWRKLTGAE